MKHKKLTACLWSCLISSLMSISGTYCLLTAFAFTPVQPEIVLWFSVLASVFFSVLFSLHKSYYPWIGVLLLLCGGLLWGDVISGILALCNAVSRIYDAAYHWGILEVTGINGAGQALDLIQTDKTPALCLIGAILAFFSCRGIAGGKRVYPAILCGVLTLSACCVVTDTIPDAVWIYLLLFCFLFLLLTGLTRRKNPTRSNRQMVVVLVAGTLFINLLAVGTSPENYNPDNNRNLSRQFGQWLQEVWRQLSGMDDPTQENFWSSIQNPQEEVMYITAEEDGIVYLRGVSMDLYLGNRWSLSNENRIVDWADSYMINTNQIQIRTKRIEPILYIPYYADDYRYVAAHYPNSGGETEYSYRFRDIDLGRYPNPISSHYQINSSTNMQLPEETVDWAKALAGRIVGNETSVLQKAAMICSYVRSSAKYDLKTTVPMGTEDVAKWFLEESDTGFCTHYATAAAVLLRASGIPARYVTGYLVKVRGGETVTVRNRHAHAWVELQLPGVGWVKMEPTPAGGFAQEETPVESTTQEETTQQQTQENTESQETQEQTQQSTTEESQDITTQTQQGTDKPIKEEKTTHWYWIVGAVAVLPIQWQLRVVWKKKRKQRGSTNRQALVRWREYERLCRYLNKQPEKDLLALARKAKFSQYAITQEELAFFDHSLQEAYSAIRKHPFPLRVYYRLVLALY